MEIENLSHAVYSKTITIERLSKDQDGLPSYVILGTPTLDRNEIFELMGVLRHEIRWRDQQLMAKTGKK